MHDFEYIATKLEISKKNYNHIWMLLIKHIKIISLKKIYIIWSKSYAFIRIRKRREKMIGIIDYGSGNIQAIATIYKNLNIDYLIISDPDDLKS